MHTMCASNIASQLCAGTHICTRVCAATDVHINLNDRYYDYAIMCCACAACLARSLMQSNGLQNLHSKSVNVILRRASVV